MKSINGFLKNNFGDCYKNKKVLVTGVRGFKASWLSIWLKMLGAYVIGYSLDHPLKKGNYYSSQLSTRLDKDILGDINNLEFMKDVFKTYQPDIVFHLAANPLVRSCYNDPIGTFMTNSIGTANILECIKNTKSIKCAIMITSDKCYKNIEQMYGYRENDRLEGVDPYSASKSCASIIINSYRHTYFQNEIDNGNFGIAEVRAGNVIGGGDWSTDRIVPDCIKSILSNKDIIIRNRYATRPWEHVLEPLSMYLRAGQLIMQDPKMYSDTYNAGPDISCNKPVIDLVESIIKHMNSDIRIIDQTINNNVHECGLLFLDATKSYRMLNWRAKMTFYQSIEFTCDWYNKSKNMDNTIQLCEKQIQKYCEL